MDGDSKYGPVLGPVLAGGWLVALMMTYVISDSVALPENIEYNKVIRNRVAIENEAIIEQNKVIEQSNAILPKPKVIVK